MASSVSFKSGVLAKKRLSYANGKHCLKGRRSWKKVIIIVRNLCLYKTSALENIQHQQKQQQDFEKKLHTLDLYYNPSNKIQANNIHKNNNNNNNNKTLVSQTPNNHTPKKQPTFPTFKKSTLIELNHAFAKKSILYTKKPHVFNLLLADRSEFLFEAQSEEEMNSWIECINFAAACLSPPIDTETIKKQIETCNFVFSNATNKTQHQTKKSYWEQLVSHDEHLQWLKAELDTHLASAPVNRKMSKKDRVQFVEMVAYLKSEIERYDYYVECMRKKSNSHEAIILSKHPQIASFTPSTLISH